MQRRPGDTLFSQPGQDGADHGRQFALDLGSWSSRVAMAKVADRLIGRDLMVIPPQQTGRRTLRDDDEIRPTETVACRSEAVPEQAVVGHSIGERTVERSVGSGVGRKGPPVEGDPLGEWVQRAVDRTTSATRPEVLHQGDGPCADKDLQPCPGGPKFGRTHAGRGLPLPLEAQFRCFRHHTPEGHCDGCRG